MAFLSQLRMNRLSEMIHASAEHNENRFAKVTVHFCNIQDTDVRPNAFVHERTDRNRDVF